jgi:Ca2+/H+ antiporter, TMEM165/GDT1 family
VSLALIASTFGLIALAELPDKTMIATLIMGSRSRPLFVWIGASAAFLVHVTLAVVAGRLLTLLPHKALEIAITVIFLLGAAYLLFVPEKEEESRGETEAAAESARTGWRVILTAFGVIVVGEFGDLTQLLTVSLVARYHQPVSVFIGALAALICVAALGAFGGRFLLRVLPVSAIRRLGGLVLVGFAAFSIYSLVHS